MVEKVEPRDAVDLFEILCAELVERLFIHRSPKLNKSNFVEDF